MLRARVARSAGTRTPVCRMLVLGNTAERRGRTPRASHAHHCDARRRFHARPLEGSKRAMDHCDGCGADQLVPRSGFRSTCLSCATRRMCNSAAHLVDRLLPNLPLRQWVVRIPWMCQSEVMALSASEADPERRGRRGMEAPIETAPGMRLARVPSSAALGGAHFARSAELARRTLAALEPRATQYGPDTRRCDSHQTLPEGSATPPCRSL